jgi:hypothetical protein
MKFKTIYLVLCVIGVALPYQQFVPWVAANGLHVRLLFEQAFATRASGFFAMDVMVSGLVLLVFAGRESSRIGVRHRWIVLVALLAVGVSLALPLFLYMRERRLERG